MKFQDFKLYRNKNYIDGEWVDSDSGDTISVNNPANLKEIGTVPKCGTSETKKAIESANNAWPEWKAKSARQRSEILRKWFDLIIKNKEELAQIMTTEQGKPINESRGEIVYGASFIEWFSDCLLYTSPSPRD